MNNNLERIMFLLLKNKNLTETIQKRIVLYGIKEKNFQILSTLASRNDLSSEVFDILNNQNSYLVKIALLARENISEDFIMESISKETRVKVLASLAESDQLSEKVYRAIIKSSKNRKVLSNIIMNSKISEELKNMASLKLINEFDGKYINTIDAQYFDELRFIFQYNNSVLNLLKIDGSLTQAYFLSQKRELSESEQLNFTKRYIAYITPELNKTNYSYYDNPPQRFIDFVNGLTGNGAIYQSVYNLLEPIFETIKNNTSGYLLQRVNDSMSEAYRAQPIGVEQYNNTIESIYDKDSLDNIVVLLSNQKTTKSLPFPEKRLNNFSKYILTLDYVSDTALSFVDELAGYRGDFFETIKNSVASNDYKKLARFYSYIRSLDLNSILEIADEKEPLILEILHLSDKLSVTKFQHLLSSEYFKEEYIKFFPVNIISNIIDNEIFINGISNILTEVLESQTYFENLETLMENYEGSLGGLVSTVKVI
jgi:hypothetical protein